MRPGGRLLRSLAHLRRYLGAARSQQVDQRHDTAALGDRHLMRETIRRALRDAISDALSTQGRHLRETIRNALRDALSDALSTQGRHLRRETT